MGKIKLPSSQDNISTTKSWKLGFGGKEVGEGVIYNICKTIPTSPNILRDNK